MILRPYAICFVDAGLYRFHKTGNLKKQILLASCILECDINTTYFFLNDKKVRFRYLKFIILGIKSVFNLIISIILFKLKKWN